MSINLVVRGNLGQTFSLKTINRDGSNEPSTVLNFSVASTRYKKQGDRYVAAGPAEWLECEYWNRRAQHLEKVLCKGMPVIIEGEELIEFYEKDGQQIKTRRIRVENICLNLSSERIESVLMKPARSAQEDGQDGGADDGDVPF